MVTLPADGYISSNARTVGERKQFLEDLRQFLEDRFGLDSGILARSQNALNNGNFDWWQRGTSTTTTATTKQYLPDRWLHKLNGAGGSITVSRQAHTLGQTDVPGEPTYYYRANLTAAPATSSRPLEQRIEGVRRFAGQTVTVSFWIKADAAQTFDCAFVQNFGTGGTPSAEVTLTQSFSVSTSWQQIILTYDLAAISSKTIGNDNNDYLGLRIESNVGTLSTYTLDIAQVQVEPGDGATPFDQRAAADELDVIQRYYAKSYNLDVDPGTSTRDGGVIFKAHTTSHREPLVYPRRMRAVPTITLYSSTGASGNWRDFTATADRVAATADAGERACQVSLTATVDGNIMVGHFTVDAEL